MVSVLLMQHTWTIVKHDGSNHLVLWLNQVFADADLEAAVSAGTVKRAGTSLCTHETLTKGRSIFSRSTENTCLFIIVSHTTVFTGEGPALEAAVKAATTKEMMQPSLFYPACHLFSAALNSRADTVLEFAVDTRGHTA